MKSGPFGEYMSSEPLVESLEVGARPTGKACGFVCRQTTWTTFPGLADHVHELEAPAVVRP